MIKKSTILLSAFVLLIVICGMSCSFAQQGFRVQYHNVYPPIYTPNTKKFKVVSCADGGYGIGFLAEDFYSISYPIVLKTDSNGVLDWKNTYPISTPSYFDLGAGDLIATPDSGFFFRNYQLNDMFGDYPQTKIYKLSKYGGIDLSIQTDWGINGFDGFDMQFVDLNPSPLTLTTFVREWHYDGFSNSCCYRNAVVELDSNLNQVWGMEVSFPTSHLYYQMKALHLNGSTYGFITNDNSLISLVDTLGNLKWAKNLSSSYDWSYFQADSNIYIFKDMLFPLRHFVIKMDLYGNVIFCKKFDAPQVRILEALQADSSSIYLAALDRIISNSDKGKALMIRMSNDGTILQAIESTDSTYTYASIDPKNKAFLFTKDLNTNGVFGCQFDKVYFTNPICGYDTIALTTIDTLLYITNSTATTAPYILPLLTSSDSVLSRPVFATFICGPLYVDEVYGHNSMNNLKLFPNPSEDVLNVQYETPANIPAEIRIIDILGREKFLDIMYNGKSSISTKNLEPGVYFIRVNDESKSISGRFVKK